MSLCSARIELRSAIVAVCAILGVIVLAATLVPSVRGASDDNHTMNIRGYVYDDHGNKIANADVTVTMYNGATPGVSHTGTSDVSPKGYFSINFASGEWAHGNKVRVVAQYQGGAQGVNETLFLPADSTSVFFQWENVTLPYEISQFGGASGLLLTAGIVGVVAVVVLVWKRPTKRGT